MHASLNEDLIQPKKLEMGISHRTGGRTGHFDWGWHEITPGLSLALIGNASGADCGGGAGSRSEAFSIRRLGGSRWRLRRTRCAIGFECQLAAESRGGRAAANEKSCMAMIDRVACG